MSLGLIASLKACLKEAAEVSHDHPVVISDFIQGAVEIECDGVGKMVISLLQPSTSTYENAGVHSGDATLVLPAQNLTAYTEEPRPRCRTARS
jgi:carbamoylphosphate synthase large subunit